MEGCVAQLSVITSPVWAPVPVKGVGEALGLYLSSSWSFQGAVGKRKWGISQRFLPFAESVKFSRIEVFVFKKNQCSHRRSNFFIKFLRKLRLALKLLMDSR